MIFSRNQYVEQPADSIRLYVSEGRPNYEQFSILKGLYKNFNTVKVSYGILGASHYVHVKSPTHELAEICACVDGDFSESDNIVFAKHLKDIANNAIHLKGDRYSFEYKKVAGKTLIKNELRHLRHHKNKESLNISYKFPGKHFFSEKALTELLLNFDGESLEIRSVHTYPNEDAAVFTKSTLHCL